MIVANVVPTTLQSLHSDSLLHVRVRDLFQSLCRRSLAATGDNSESIVIPLAHYSTQCVNLVPVSHVSRSVLGISDPRVLCNQKSTVPSSLLSNIIVHLRTLCKAQN